VIGHKRPPKRGKLFLGVAVAFLATVLSIHAGNASSSVTGGNELPAEVGHLLQSAEKATLYSLEPWEDPAPTEDTLHGFKIIGRTDLDSGLAKRVIATFKEAISSSRDPVAGCFDPRHALRVTSGAESYDLLLCYACGQLEIFSADRLIADLSAHGT